MVSADIGYNMSWFIIFDKQAHEFFDYNGKMSKKNYISTSGFIIILISSLGE